jgi:hypothetical protein
MVEGGVVEELGGRLWRPGKKRNGWGSAWKLHVGNIGKRGGGGGAGMKTSKGGGPVPTMAWTRWRRWLVGRLPHETEEELGARATAAVGSAQ